MEFEKKYRHVGVSFAEVDKGWMPIIEKTIKNLEREMWPRWIPMFVKRWIHYLATGNSVVRIKYRWAYDLRTKLTKGQTINQIKSKYAGLRIYGFFHKKGQAIIKEAEIECNETCELCGSKKEVKAKTIHGWITNMCTCCFQTEENKKTRQVLFEKRNNS